MALFGRHTPGPQLLPLTLTPKQVRRWVAALPLTNIGETTRQFYQALLNINAQTANPGQRLVTLEILLPTAQLILTNIRRRLVNQTFPLSHKTHKIYELQQSIALELSAAYRLVADKLLEHPSRGKGKWLPLAIYRSMDFGIQRLFAAANLYMPYAPDSWQSVYELYRIAEKEAILRDTILCLDRKTLTPPSIEQLFLRATILTACQPRALHQGDSERLNLIFPELVAGCSIRRGPPDPAAGPVCAVDLSSGMPPYHRALPSPPDTGSIRHVDLAPFVNHLRELIEESPPSPPVAAMARRLLDRLATAAVRACERQNARGEKMIVSFGLNEICRTLRQTRTVAQPAQVRRSDRDADSLALAPIGEGPTSSEHILYAPAPQGPRVDWDIIAKGGLIRDNAPAPQEVPQTTKGAYEESLDPCQSWDVINASEGGVRLSSGGCEASLAQVGELVGLHRDRPEAGQGSWALGLVRWMFNPRPTHIQIGVQLLSSSIEVVGLEAAQTPSKNSFSALDGLLLHRTHSHDTKRVLIVPAGHFDVDTEVLLELADTEVHASLRERMEQTASYECFRYLIARRDAPSGELEGDETEDEAWSEILDGLAETGQGEGQDPPDFDLLWRSL